MTTLERLQYDRKRLIYSYGSMRTLLFVILLSLYAVDSQLIRDRSVQCNSNEMLVTFEFSQPFNGVIYANKFYQIKACRWEGNGSRRLQVTVPLTTNANNQVFCGVQLKENLGEFAVTLLISPMKGLLVEGMDMVIIRCLYTIGDVTLTLSPGTNGAGIQISPHTQGSVVTGSGGSPFLQMAIRDGHGINNELTQVAQVGQRITLDVIMRDTTIYDFYVHDCYAHDGTNTPEASINIIDQNGCAVRLNRAVDVPVFVTAPIPNGAKHVYVHMYGFQFTTSQFVYFECQVRPCLQSCNRPQCITNSSSLIPTTKPAKLRRAVKNVKSEIQSDTTNPHDNYNLTTVIRIEPQQLVAFTPGASSLNLDAPSKASGNDIHSSKRSSSTSDVCVNMSVAICLLIAFILVCLVSLAIAVFVCHKTHKDHARESDTGNSETSTTNDDNTNVRRRFFNQRASISDHYSSILSSEQFVKTISRAGNSDQNYAIGP